VLPVLTSLICSNRDVTTWNGLFLDIISARTYLLLKQRTCGLLNIKMYKYLYCFKWFANLYLLCNKYFFDSRLGGLARRAIIQIFDLINKGKNTF